MGRNCWCGREQLGLIWGANGGAVGSKWWLCWDHLSSPPFAVSFAVGACRNGLGVRVHGRVTAGIGVQGLDQVLGKLVRDYF